MTFVGKVLSLLFNMLSRLVITFLPRSNCLLISWLQSPSAVILEIPKKSVTVSTSICHEVMGTDAMMLVFWMLSFKPTFSLFSFTFIKRLFSSSGTWYFTHVATFCFGGIKRSLSDPTGWGLSEAGVPCTWPHLPFPSGDFALHPVDVIAVTFNSRLSPRSPPGGSPNPRVILGPQIRILIHLQMESYGIWDIFQNRWGINPGSTLLPLLYYSDLSLIWDSVYPVKNTPLPWGVVKGWTGSLGLRDANC